MKIDLFEYVKIQRLNELEFRVYNYLVKNLDIASALSIRDLANETHVSTTVILQFCKKLDCDGYTDFKTKLLLSKYVERQTINEESFNEITNFLHKIEAEGMQLRLKEAATIILRAKVVIFIGAGSSEIIAKYGARHLTDMGKICFHLDEPLFPLPDADYTKTVIVILSVSGESPMMISQVNRFKKLGSTIISITNTSSNTIANMADLSFSYYVPPKTVNPFQLSRNDVTTQVPALHLLEKLGNEIYSALNTSPPLKR